MHTRLVIALALAALLSAGCGKKGALYHPDGSKKPTPTPQQPLPETPQNTK